MLSRKAYVMLARVITERVREENECEVQALGRYARALADELHRDNPQFNRDRFLKACVVDD